MRVTQRGRRALIATAMAAVVGGGGVAVGAAAFGPATAQPSPTPAATFPPAPPAAPHPPRGSAVLHTITTRAALLLHSRRLAWSQQAGAASRAPAPLAGA